MKVKDATSAVANVDDYTGSARLLAATTLRKIFQYFSFSMFVIFNLQNIIFQLPQQLYTYLSFIHGYGFKPYQTKLYHNKPYQPITNNTKFQDFNLISFVFEHSQDEGCFEKYTPRGLIDFSRLRGAKLPTVDVLFTSKYFSLGFVY